MSDAKAQRKVTSGSEFEKRGGYPAGGSGSFVSRPMPRNFPKRPVVGASGQPGRASSGARER